MSRPRVITRDAQPYAALRGEVSMQTIGAVADRFPELFDHLADQGIEAAGAPFLRYAVLGPGEEVTVEAGLPVDVAGAAAGEVSYAVLPAGRYVTVSHHGHPDDLREVTGDLLDWAADQELVFDVVHDGGIDGEVWGARLEVYNTDPREEPDPNSWDTDLVFRLAD